MQISKYATRAMSYYCTDHFLTGCTVDFDVWKKKKNYAFFDIFLEAIAMTLLAIMVVSLLLLNCTSA